MNKVLMIGIAVLILSGCASMTPERAMQLPEESICRKYYNIYTGPNTRRILENEMYRRGMQCDPMWAQLYEIQMQRSLQMIETGNNIMYQQSAPPQVIIIQ